VYEQTILDEAPTLEALEIQIDESGQGLQHAVDTAGYLHSLESRVLEAGEVDRTTMRSLETMFPGAVHPDYPVNAYTAEASRQHLDISLESFSSATGKVLQWIRKALTKVMEAISNFISKLLGRNDGKLKDKADGQEKASEKTKEAAEEFDYEDFLERYHQDREAMLKDFQAHLDRYDRFTQGTDIQGVAYKIGRSDGDIDQFGADYIKEFFPAVEKRSDSAAQIQKLAFTASPGMEALLQIAETAKDHRRGLLGVLDHMEEAVENYSEAFDETDQASMVGRLNKTIAALEKTKEWFGDPQRPSKVYEDIQQYWSMVHGESMPNGSNFMGTVKEKGILTSSDFYLEFFGERENLKDHPHLKIVHEIEDEFSRQGMDTKFLKEVNDRRDEIVSVFEAVDKKKRSLKTTESERDEDGNLVINLGEGNTVSGRVIELENEVMGLFREATINLQKEYRAMAGLVGYHDMARMIGIVVYSRLERLEKELTDLLESLKK
jgi:hypothetical protein